MTTTDPAPRRRPRKRAFDKATATWRILVVTIAIGAGALARMALPGGDDSPVANSALRNGVLGSDLPAPTAPTLADAGTTSTRPTIVVVRRPSAAPVARTRAS
ncbi:MAG: hypothetical protein R6W77_14630 [Trueperaceae bacterium]